MRLRHVFHSLTVCMYYGFVIYLDDKRLAVRAKNLPGKYHYPDQVGV